MMSAESSLELVYVYIKNYKIFNNQGFCFCPEYEISCKNSKNKLSLEIKRKENFVDLFKDKNISLSVICGRNGSGKTTLLEAIQEVSNDVICLYRDGNENFFATENLTLKINNKIFNLEKDSIIANKFSCSIENTDFSFKNMVEYYTEKKELFDGILPEQDELFSMFRVKIWNIEEHISSIKFDDDTDYSKKLLNEIHEYKSHFQQNPFMLYALLNKEFRECFFLSIKGEQEEKFSREFHELIEDVLSDSSIDDKYKEIKRLQSEIFNKPYCISKFDQVRQNVMKLEDLYTNVLEKIASGEASVPFDSFIFYDGYKNFENSDRHLENLSSGELQRIKYRYQLFNVLKNKNASVCCFDEPESSLHPEWCRLFLNDFLESFSKVKSILDEDELFNNRKISFIISTHSPFILSDVTNDYIIYLERQSDGTTKQVKRGKEPFAGNIGELFIKNLFMEGTIGEFSNKKIKEIVNKINSDSLEKNKMEEYKKLINHVGDKILRQILTDMIEDKNEENRVK